MNYVLFLDDIRELSWVNDPVLCPSGARVNPAIIKTRLAEHPVLVARNLEEFKQVILEQGIPVFVWFDHDLDIQHYHKHQQGAPGTGLECAKFLVEQCTQQNQPIPDYCIHSKNPDGAQDIREFLEKNS